MSYKFITFKNTFAKRVIDQNCLSFLNLVFQINFLDSIFFDDHEQTLAKHQTKKEMLLHNKKKLKSSGVSYTIAIDYRSYLASLTLIILFMIFQKK
jgi:hypothetical protein